jgi:threonine dehydratase
LVLHYVDDMATVSEEAIRSTMFFMWERMKIVVEPTGVLAAAALLSGVVQAENRRIGVIVSGGNVDFSH